MTPASATLALPAESRGPNIRTANDQRIDMIADEAGLEALCARLPEAPVLAVDTEFVRVRTYFPVLCLIQINDGERLSCVDTVRIRELDPLMRAIDAHARPMAIHSGRQDFETLYLRSGRLPRAVRDTQIAAAMVGMGAQISYAQTVEELVGVTLAKSQTRTNWAKRPLTDKQLHYAADDVRYLPDLDATLTTRLAALGREDWLREDCARLLDPALYEPDIDGAWRKCKSRARFTPRERGAWRNLCALRERVACERDRPRRWIVEDGALESLARYEAHERERIDKTLRRAKAHTALTVDRVAEAIASAAEVDDQRAPRPDAAAQARIDRALAQVRRVAKDLDVNASLLATRRDVVSVVQGAPFERVFGGWRESVLAEALRPMLDDAAGGHHA